jgi:hypothetical protein
MPFYRICSTIIQLPAIILEALDKYPNSTEKEQDIYYRYDFIHSRTQLAFGKFMMYNIALEGVFNYFLAKGNKQPLINLFIFTDTFINQLKNSNSGTKHFKTKLFRELFSSIMNYKERYISVFGDFQYSNIIEVEMSLKNELENIRPKKDDFKPIDTLENACGGSDSKQYKDIKKWFIDNNLCDPDTFIWKKGKTELANYIQDLHTKGYTVSLKQREIITIALKSFQKQISRRTINNLQGNHYTKSPPEIPPFKS